MESLLFAGTYNAEGEQGLFPFAFNEETGRLRPLQGGALTDHPSFAAVFGDVLYAVSEVKDKGRLEAYRILPEPGRLAFLSAVEIPASAMCHAAVWPGGRFVSCANYLSGSFAVFPTEDGKLGQPVYTEAFSGHGFLSRTRQDASHVHSTCISPEGGKLLVADLGLDRVHVYDIDTERGIVERAAASEQIVTPDGTGPRHMVFSADGRFLYLVGELSNQCLVYRWSRTAAQLIQTVSLLRPGFSGETKAADIHFSPEGAFLYVSNRGEDSIAVFAVDADTGRLRPAESACAGGRFPRHFCVTTHCLLIANRYGGGLTVCRRDRETGHIGAVIDRAELPQPVFVGLTEKKI